MLSTIAPTLILRLFVLTLLMSATGGCAGHIAPLAPPTLARAESAGAFVMPDGVRLPYRRWLPAGEPLAVVLALHGMNDSRDAWEIPAPALAAAGIAVFSPDQRGFGEAARRGFWQGLQALVDDAREMARMLRARYSSAKLILMGESMGGAVLMCLETSPRPPPVDGFVLVAPAVWGRAEMNLFMRAALWAAAGIAPGARLSGAPVRVQASDNRDALIRLSRDPLTIGATRVDSIKGLVDLMDAALASAPDFHAPALFLYGGKDELVPEGATARLWRSLPAGTRLAFYPRGYHLLMRDLDRAVPINDVIAWIDDPAAPLPSGAEAAARAWLARQD